MAAPSRFLIQVVKDVTIVNFQDKHIRDLPEIEAIGRELYDLIESHDARKVILNFSKVQALSSQALGVLITLQSKAKAAKSRVVFCSMSSELARVFKIARLEHLFEFHDEESEALASFGVASTG